MIRFDKEKLIPSEDKLSPDDPYYEEVIKRHKKAIENGEDNYKDPRTGFLVFTAKYLLERDYCCNSGCRHCPYE